MNNRTSKIIQVISYLLQKEKRMNYMKLIKLVYFADKLHLKKYWKTITNDVYFALPKWPLGSLTSDIIKSPEQLNLEWELPFEKDWFDLKTKTQITDFDRISELERQDLDKIYDIFWWYSEWKLVELTHNYKEWRDLEQKVNEYSRVEMPVESFFQNSDSQDSIFNIPEEEVAVAKDLYYESLENEI